MAIDERIGASAQPAGGRPAAERAATPSLRTSADGRAAAERDAGADATRNGSANGTSEVHAQAETDAALTPSGKRKRKFWFWVR